MSKAGRRFAKLLLTAACFAWVGGAGWLLFTDVPEDELQTHSSEAVKERMKECQGSFKERFDCKETIVIETHRKTFWSLTERLLIVTVPAILVGLAGGLAIRRIPADRPHEVIDTSTDWKVKAQQHIAHPSMDDHET